MQVARHQRDEILCQVVLPSPPFQWLNDLHVLFLPVIRNRLYVVVFAIDTPPVLFVQPWSLTCNHGRPGGEMIYFAFRSSRYGFFALYDSICERASALSFVVEYLLASNHSMALTCHSQAVGKSPFSA